MSQYLRRRPLVLLLIAFGIVACAHSAAVPIFEAPDEAWHYRYVRWIQGYSVPNPPGLPQVGIAHPPLYYAVAALTNAPFPEKVPPSGQGNPHFGYQALGTLPDNKNMLIHTAEERFPWQGAYLTLHVTRLTSVLFGLLAVYALWGLSWETFRNRYAAVFATALVAFHPQFVFISSIINIDSAATAFATLALWIAAHTLRRDLTRRRAVLLGGIVGAGLLTKSSLLPMFPLLFLFLLWLLRFYQSRSAKFSVTALGLYTGTTFAVGGWWYLKNLLLYGDLLGVAGHVDTPWQRAEAASFLTVLKEIPLLIKSFWGSYGWGHIWLPSWLYWVLTGAAAYFLIWGVVALIKKGHAAWTGDAGSLPTLVVLLLSVIWTGGIAAAVFLWMRSVEAPHGRLLFPALGTLALLMTAGMLEAQSNKRGRLSLAAKGFLLLLSATTTLAPGTRILAAFMPPRRYSPEKIADTVRPINYTYQDALHLIGVELTPQRVSPGGTVTLKACWEALTPIENNYMVFVQLRGRADSRVGERHTYPGLGRYPTSHWSVGEAFCDTYYVETAAWAPTPEQYDVLLGFYEDQPQHRLRAVNEAGEVVDPPVVANLAMVPKEFSLSPQYPTTYDLGETISLIGYDQQGTLRSQSTLTVTLYWKAQTSPAANYTVFFQLLDDEMNVLAQDDGLPREGGFPTTVWQPGDIVPDTHTVNIETLPEDASLRLVTGLYHAETMQRLPVSTPTGERVPHDHVPLIKNP